MHIEILVEDSSGKKLLDLLLPKLLGEQNAQHSWRVHSYRGIGRIRKGLHAGGDPEKRILLDQLPRLLRGYGKTGYNAVVVVLDSDRRNCKEFLAELHELAERCDAPKHTMFRLAIEEVEAWYFGDRIALQGAYPKAKANVLGRYDQDSVCNAWEMLADATHPGGSGEIKKKGWPLPGQLKYEWAERIGPLLEPDRNLSPSFGKLRDGLRRLVERGS